MTERADWDPEDGFEKLQGELDSLFDHIRKLDFLLEGVRVYKTPAQVQVELKFENLAEERTGGRHAPRDAESVTQAVAERGE